MLTVIIIILNPNSTVPDASNSTMSLFLKFRRWVHIPKPERHTYKLYDHKIDRRSGSTRSSRTAPTKEGTAVRCRLNRVTAGIQGILAFLAKMWLKRQPKSIRIRTIHPLVEFANTMNEHCTFGILLSAKTYQKYANLMDMDWEYDHNWHNKYASQYILFYKKVYYVSFQALIAFLRNSKKLDDYTEDDMAKIVDGFVSLCALPDYKFRTCFDKYDGKNKDAFYDFLVNKIEQVVEEMWSGKSKDEFVETYNEGAGGTGRDWYFNIRDCYFPA